MRTMSTRAVAIAAALLGAVSGCSDAPGGAGSAGAARSNKQALCSQTALCFTNTEVSQGVCELHPNYTKCASVAPLSGQEPLHKQAEFVWTIAGGDIGAEHPLQYDHDLSQFVGSRLDRTRLSVLRGQVKGFAGSSVKGLTGVRVEAVAAGLGYGQVFTEWGSEDPLGEPTGRYFIAVNAGGPPIRLRFTKQGYFSAERLVQPVAGEYVALDPVELVPIPASTPVTPGQQTALSAAAETDADGQRSARVFFPAGVVWHDGSFTGPLITQSVNIAVKEFTVGPTGDQRMPAALPPTSAYTYAIALRATQGSGTTELHPYFSQPVFVYVDDFLPNIPVGATVPSGYYDSSTGQWTQYADAAGASKNGKVIKIIDYSGGTANVDTDNDGVADNNAEGMTLAERQQLHTWYSPAVNKEVWRVPITHFSEVDFNWSFGLPADAIAALFGVSAGGTDGACSISGSIIECENQVLGEEIPIASSQYKLVYRSGRVPGYSAARQARLTIPKSSLPDSAKQVICRVTVAGKDWEATHDRPGTSWPAGGVTCDYTWDGMDSFGRQPSGAQPATFKVGLVYDGSYAPTAQFGLPPGAQSFTASPTRKEITLWNTWKGTLGGLDSKRLGFGGWTLDVQHAYAPESQTVYFGHGGQQRGAVLAQKLSSFVGSLDSPRGMTFGPDGALYVANSKNATINNQTPQDGEVLKIKDGVTTVLAFGTLKNPTDVAVASDGTVFVTESGRHRVKKLPPGGSVVTVAGSAAANGEQGDADGLGTTSRLNFPAGLALAPDGSVYVADFQNHKVRRIAPDGMVTTVVNPSGQSGVSGGEGDGGLATAPGVRLGDPIGLAVDAGGNLYIADRAKSRVRRVSPSGIITTFAGGGTDDFSEGIPATAAELSEPYHVAAGADGALYVSDISGTGATRRRVRKITTERRIVSVAGSGGAMDCAGDGGPALSANFKAPDGIAIGADGALYVGDDLCNSVRKVIAPLPGVALGFTIVPSADGSEYYTFDEAGRHLETTDAWTGRARFSFEYTWYPSGELLTAVRDVRRASDGTGIVTTIERDSAGVIAGIHTTTGGQGINVWLDGSGWLSYVSTRWNGHGWYALADGNGLLQVFGDTHYHFFTYGADGRLTHDRDWATSDPSPAFRQLSRASTSTSATVSVTTPSGLMTSYGDERLPSGARRRTVTGPDGTVVMSTTDLKGGRTVALHDGSTRTSAVHEDPRFGLAAPSSIETLDLGGKTLVVDTQRSATGSQDLGFTTFTETQTVKSSATDTGKPYKVTIDRTNTFAPFVRLSAPSATLAPTTNREVRATLDAHGRVVQLAQETSPEVSSVAYEYDSGGSGPGRLTRITQGNRRVRFDWDPQTGFLTAVHRGTPSNETLLSTYYSFDNDGLLWRRQTTQADVLFWFDQSGNLRWFGHDAGAGPAHSLSPEWWFDGLGLHDPPYVAGVSPDVTAYAHDNDRRLGSISYANGSSLGFGYHAQGVGSAGKLQSIAGTYPASSASLTYDAVGRLSSVVTTSGVSTGFHFNGNAQHGWGKLLRAQSTTWPGGPAKEVEFGYDGYLRLSSEAPTGGAQVSFQYDNDSLVTAVTSSGLFTFDVSDRSSVSGRVNKTTVGPERTTYSYAPTYGDLAGLNATWNLTSNVYQMSLTRDELARVDTKTEKVGAGPAVTTNHYYDGEGRIWITSGPGGVHVYGYDSRGNRTSADGETATYDAQDRILTRGAITYQHDAAGRRTLGNSTWPEQYFYDAGGNLIRVEFPGYPGEWIEYMLDGLGRRIGRKHFVGYALWTEQRWLYADGDRIVAELDGNGALTKQFVYATGRNVPDLMIAGSTVYRILTDDLGSVRVVLNLSTGNAEQIWEYDPWGKAQFVSGTPWLQPFGYAGGLFDWVTTLVHFGAREYDPHTGRWLTRDPVLFDGGLNLYEYASSDPVNLTDSSGTIPLAPPVAGFALGFGGDVALQLAANGGKLGCVDWRSAASAGAIGAVGGTLGVLGKGVKGFEFSHFVPRRFTGKYGLPSAFVNSSLNGNYVPWPVHAMTDAYRFRFVPRAIKPMIPQLPAGLAQAGRVPAWVYGGVAGAALTE